MLERYTKPQLLFEVPCVYDLLTGGTVTGCLGRGKARRSGREPKQCTSPYHPPSPHPVDAAKKRWQGLTDAANLFALCCGKRRLYTAVIYTCRKLSVSLLPTRRLLGDAAVAFDGPFILPCRPEPIHFACEGFASTSCGGSTGI